MSHQIETINKEKFQKEPNKNTVVEKYNNWNEKFTKWLNSRTLTIGQLWLSSLRNKKDNEERPRHLCDAIKYIFIGIMGIPGDKGAKEYLKK